MKKRALDWLSSVGHARGFDLGSQYSQALCSLQHLLLPAHMPAHECRQQHHGANWQVQILGQNQDVEHYSIENKVWLILLTMEKHHFNFFFVCNQVYCTSTHTKRKLKWGRSFNLYFQKGWASSQNILQLLWPIHPEASLLAGTLFLWSDCCRLLWPWSLGEVPSGLYRLCISGHKSWATFHIQWENRKKNRELLNDSLMGWGFFF